MDLAPDLQALGPNSALWDAPRIRNRVAVVGDLATATRIAERIAEVAACGASAALRCVRPLHYAPDIVLVDVTACREGWRQAALCWPRATRIPYASAGGGSRDVPHATEGDALARLVELALEGRGGGSGGGGGGSGGRVTESSVAAIVVGLAIVLGSGFAISQVVATQGDIQRVEKRIERSESRLLRAIQSLERP